MELSLSDLSGALQRAGDTGLGLTLGGVDLKSVIEILISGIDTVTSKASEIEATAEKRALQAAQELQKAKDEINKQMEKLKEETLAYTDALHEQQITALQAHRATIQSVLERQTECHSELQEATSRSFDLFSTKMDNLRMHHRHAVSCGLMGALHTNLRKIYFLKLMKNLEQRKHEQKKSNLLERLGYRTDIQRMRTAYAVLQTHARVERMRAVRIRHLRVLCNSTSKGTQRDRYRAWAAFAKVKAEKRRRKTEVNNNVVKSCMQLIATGRMRYWFSLLNKNLKYGRERRMRHEMARAMSMNTKQGQKQVVWDHWVTYLRNFQKRTKQSKVSNKFLLVVTRSVRQVYYDKWSQFRIRSRTKKMLKQKLLQLNNINEQGLKAKTYQTWMKKSPHREKKNRTEKTGGDNAQNRSAKPQEGVLREVENRGGTNEGKQGERQDLQSQQARSPRFQPLKTTRSSSLLLQHLGIMDKRKEGRNRKGRGSKQAFRPPPKNRGDVVPDGTAPKNCIKHEQLCPATSRQVHDRG
eukprot:TRINITY_DN9811_c0_g1_i2.p1 TRINITY_DN9811_c0_g1~~TRINITY_DN9811_c0_g1_i2.p1  ORF type:complete len:525 (+),score=73.39 TRINITY_DN9811_c0_g1_i2:35-1609(+)